MVTKITSQNRNSHLNSGRSKDQTYHFTENRKKTFISALFALCSFFMFTQQAEAQCTLTPNPSGTTVINITMPASGQVPITTANLFGNISSNAPTAGGIPCGTTPCSQLNLYDATGTIYYPADGSMVFDCTNGPLAANALPGGTYIIVFDDDNSMGGCESAPQPVDPASPLTVMVMVNLPDGTPPVWNAVTAPFPSPSTSMITTTSPNSPSTVTDNAAGRTTTAIVLEANDPNYAAELAYWTNYPGNGSTAVTPITPTATDNCDTAPVVATMTYSPTTNYCSSVDAGANSYNGIRYDEIRWSATDATGNSLDGTSGGFFRLRVTTIDTIGPTISAANIPTTSTTYPGALGNEKTFNGSLTLNLGDYYGAGGPCGIYLDGTIDPAETATPPNVGVTATDIQGVTYMGYTITPDPATGTGTFTSTTGSDAGVVGFFPAGSYEIVYNVRDDNTSCTTPIPANQTTSHFRFTLNVMDNVPPSFTGCPSNLTFTADPNSCDNNVSWPSLIVNSGAGCTGAGSAFFISASASHPATSQNIVVNVNQNGAGNFDSGDFPVGVSTVTYKVTDAAGNEALPACTFTVTITDDQAPTITCPLDQNLPYGACNPTAFAVPDYSGLATIADNCLSSVNITQSPAAGVAVNDASVVYTSGSAGTPGSTFDVTITVTDSGLNAGGTNNSVSCTFEVTLVDNGTAPIPTTSGLTLNSVTSNCGPADVPAPTALDQCNNVLYGLPSPPGTGGATLISSNPDIYTFTSSTGVTWIFDDGNGNQLSQLQNININADNTAPSITVNNCPLDIVLDANGSASLANNVSTSLNLGDDDAFPGVLDPGISLGFNFTFYNDVFSEVWISSNGLLSFEPINNANNLWSNESFPMGNASGPDNIIAFAWDDLSPNAGGSVSYSTTGVAPNRKFVLTFEDVPHFPGFAGCPTVTAQVILHETTNVIQIMSQNIMGDFADFFDGGMNQGIEGDNPIAAGVVENDQVPGRNGGFYNLVDDVVTFTPSGTGYINSQGTGAGAGFAFNTPGINLTTSDVCGADLSTLTLNGATSLNFGCNDVGLQTITIAVQDAAGNVGTTTCAVNIIDDEDPTLSGTPSDITVSCDAIPTTPNVNTFTIADNCGASGVSYNEVNLQGSNPNSCSYYNYSISRIWTTTDNNGNTATEQQDITVVDNFAPVFAPTLPSNISLNTNANDCYATYNFTIGTNDVSDNCAAFANLTITNDAFTNYGIGNGLASASGNYPPGTYIVNFRVEDPCGNVGAIYTRTLTVTDMVAPVAVCTPITIGIPTSGILVLNPNVIGSNSFDNCTTNPITLSVSPQIFTCAQAGTSVAVQLTATSGNLTNTCNTTVTLQDNAAPIALCQNISVTLDANGQATITAADINNGSFDGCSGLNVNTSIPPTTFGFANVTSSTNPAEVVTLTVSDPAGNSATCTSSITILPPPTCFDIGYQAGPEQGIVTVPVIVSDFVNVTSFQFSVEMLDPTVGEFLGISGLHSTLGAGGDFSFVEATDIINISVNNVNPITLNDGDIAFYINVRLIGITGDLSDLNIWNNPAVPPQVVQFYGGNNTVVVVPCSGSQSIGQVEIDQVAQLTVGGVIHTWYAAVPDSLVNNVTVSVDQVSTGTNAGSQTTINDGAYTVGPINGNNMYKLTPSKDINWGNGVNTNDLFAIQQNIVGQILFTENFQKIAADVNNDGLVSTVDVSLLQAALNTTYIQTPPDFLPPTNPNPAPISWKFSADSDNLTTTPSLSFTNRNTVPAYTECVTINLTANSMGNNFTAIKTGDVTKDANPDQFTGGIDADSRGDLTLTATNQITKKDEIYDISFTSASTFEDIVAMQSVLGFDSDALSFVEVIPGTLDNMHQGCFGKDLTNEGLLVMTWFDSNIENVNLEEEGVVFTLRLKAKKAGLPLSHLVYEVPHDVVGTAAFRRGNEMIDLNFEFDEVYVENNDQFELYQNSPNPFRDQTLISFQLPEATIGTISLIDMSGKVIKMYKGDFAAGYNELFIDRSEMPSSGVFYYKLDTPNHTATKRMIIIE